MTRGVAKQYNWIALDTETTGISFLNSQVIQVGAIFCDERLKKLHGQQWNINFDPDRYLWTEDAEAVHGITIEEASTHGVSALEFIDEFRTLLKTLYGTTSASQFATIGVQAYFDYVMIQNSIFEPNGDRFPVSFKMVGDLSCLGYHTNGITGLDRQLEHYGIKCDNSKRHSALYDAEMHLKLFRKLYT